MNGVRRLLGGAGQRPQSPPISNSPAADQPQSSSLFMTAPLSISSKPLWQPSLPVNGFLNGTSDSASASSSTISASPPNYMNGGTFPKPRINGHQNSTTEADLRPQSIGSVSSQRKSFPASPGTSPTSAKRSSNALSGPSSPTRPIPNRVAQLRPWKRASGTVDTRDELMMTLLASEAIVDSREFDILYSEDVEELKKEQEMLNTRVHAMQKKLKLETKIRDAAISLAKLNNSNKSISKQSSEQLEAANRKVESAQKELWRLSERANEINKKLLEHRAGVLSFSLRSLEVKLANDSDESGYGMSFRSTQMSPTSSETSYASSRTKFEGAHLFAGHENAIQPSSPRKPPSTAEFSFLEERLKEVTGKLHAANEAQNEARREASMLKVELQGLETSLALELQAAEEKMANMQTEVQRVSTLENQLRELSAERREWDNEMEVKNQKIERLERRLLEATEERNGNVAGAEERLMEFESALNTLRFVMQSHGLNLPDKSPLSQRVSYIGTHLDGMKSRIDSYQRQREEWEDLRHNLEEDVRVGLDKRESLSQEVEDARKEREEYRERVFSLEIRLKEQAARLTEPIREISYENAPTDVKNFVQVLKPIWNALPSPELRASKFGSRTRPSPSAPGSPNMSLSELDVRLLRTLYDGRPSYQAVDTSGQFTVEAFAARVQALIVDDRALIERLVRFAQAHELLKQNADRAQKIAQDSSVALETYQKQVKALEDRNLMLSTSVNSLQNEIVELRDAIDQVTSEKREVEMRAAEQAETCRQLTEANSTLSARALSLAQEAASAPELVRNQLEKQLADCKSELQKAQEDIHAMRSAEASQNIALMDELNSMQGENENLRAQLRAANANRK